jgi:hypothetical protein
MTKHGFSMDGFKEKTTHWSQISNVNEPCQEHYIGGLQAIADE